jgi:hypothetical protein
LPAAWRQRVSIGVQRVGQYFPVMDGLLAADRDGLLSATILGRSARRLEEVETGR